MKYIVDNDLHIHSKISACSQDPLQSNERILNYAIENGLRTVCLTDHFWDDAVEGASRWYMPQNYEHISAAKPLPQAQEVKFLFGCETELNKDMVLGVSKEKIDLFDFIVIPTTHFHMVGFTISEKDAADVQGRANAWVKRLDAVLDMALPFYKVGIAHLTCCLIAPTRKEFIEVLNLLPEKEMVRLFTKSAQRGVGIELNSDDMSFFDSEADIVLRPYRIAKQCGCKFYCGSDAHHPATFDTAKATFERAADMLGLTEDDKFIIKSV